MVRSKTTRWALIFALLSVGTAAHARRRDGRGGTTTTTTTTTATTGGGTSTSRPSITANAPPQAPDTVGPTVCTVPEKVAGAMECPRVSLRGSSRGSSGAPRGTTFLDTDNSHHARSAASQRYSREQLRGQAGRSTRAEDLLLNEARLTFALVRNMQLNNAQRPDALMRLAQDFEELALMYDRKATNDQLLDAVDEARRKTPPDQATIDRVEREIKGYEEKAAGFKNQLIQVYEQIIKDHPTFPKLAEVLYYLGFAYTDLKQDDKARETYRALIQQFPDSPYVPNALLSFAEFFFDNSLFAEARQFYDLVIQRGPANNAVYGYSLYKLGWVYYNTEDYPNALTTFYRLLDYGMANPDSSAGSAIFLKSVRGELVKMYGAVYGTPRNPLAVNAALDVFRKYADRQDPNGAYALLENLGELYFDEGRWNNAITIYHKLMADLENDGKLCYWQAQITKATIASRPQDAHEREITNLLDIYEAYRRDTTKSAEARNTCRDGAAQVVFEVAVHLHAVATGVNQEGQQVAHVELTPTILATMDRASRLYNLMLERFPDLDQVKFPGIQEADWPTRYRLALWRADLVYQANHLCECGPAYDQLVDLNPESVEAEDAAYRALICWDGCFREQLLNESLSSRGSRNRPASGGNANATRTAAPDQTEWYPRPLNEMETGMARAYTRYACFAQTAANAPAPAAGAQPPAAGAAGQNGVNLSQDGEDPKSLILRVKYSRAFLYYRAHHFEEAADMFRDIALNTDPSVKDDQNFRVKAVQNYFDALNFMSTKWDPARPACASKMEDDVVPLKALFCGDQAKRDKNPELCDDMDKLQCQVLATKAFALHKAKRYGEAARAYISTLRDHPECRRSPDIDIPAWLYNASLDFDANFELREGMRWREKLVEFYLPQGNPFALLSLYRLGQNCVAVQVFDCAAEKFESYADFVVNNPDKIREALKMLQEYNEKNGISEPPPDPVAQAADSLRQATIYRIALGTRANEQMAIDNARKFARYFGGIPKQARTAARVFFSIGSVYYNRALRYEAQHPNNDQEEAARRSNLREAWRAVVDHYTQYNRRFATNGTPDQKILGLVALGRALWKNDDQEHAVPNFEQVVQLWTGHASTSTDPDPNPAPGEAAIRTALQPRDGEPAETRTSPEEIEEAVTQAKEAVAEARFYLAEVVYRRFMAKRMPEYRGSGAISAFQRWYVATLKPFFEQQLEQLNREAKPTFDRVAAMKIPEWQMAAASRVGKMFFQFAEYLKKAPDPPALRSYPEALDQYHIGIDEYAQKYLDFAQIGFERCLKLSTEIHWFNEFSRECERGLHEIDKRQYPLRDEIVATGSLLYSRAVNGRPVYDLSTQGDSAEVGDIGGGSSSSTTTTTPPANPQ